MNTTLTPAPAPDWRGALRPLLTVRGYTSLTHHLLGLPLGGAYFIWFVTGLSLGLSLAVTLIGMPIPTLVLASVRLLVAVEAEAGERAARHHDPGRAARAAWRGLAQARKGVLDRRCDLARPGYLLARFPVGTLTFTIAVAAYGAALYLIAPPIVASFDPIELGIWQSDTVLEGLALVPLGLVLLVAAGWISEGLAAVSRMLAG